MELWSFCFVVCKMRVLAKVIFKVLVFSEIPRFHEILSSEGIAWGSGEDWTWIVETWALFLLDALSGFLIPGQCILCIVHS